MSDSPRGIKVVAYALVGPTPDARDCTWLELAYNKYGTKMRETRIDFATKSEQAIPATLANWHIDMLLRVPRILFIQETNISW